MSQFDHSVPAHYYSGFMEEALYSLMCARDMMQAHLKNREDLEAALHDTDTALCGLHVRHAFLLSATALEAAANGLVAAVAAGQQSLFEDLEMISTLTKFEVFAISRGVRIDRGSDKLEKIKRWIACRNAFVHPKPRRVGVGLDERERGIAVETKNIGNRDYPLVYDFVDFRHSVWFVGDVLAFVGWLVFDTCGLSIDEGARLIGAGVTSHSSDALVAADEFKFDIRSLGVDPKYHSVVRVPFPNNT